MYRLYGRHHRPATGRPDFPINPNYALDSTPFASIIDGMGDLPKAFSGVCDACGIDAAPCGATKAKQFAFALRSSPSGCAYVLAFAYAASLRSDRFGFEANDTKQFVSL